MICVDLPYPHKLLWPNGRTRSPHAKGRQVKTHKGWASWAVISQRTGKPAFAPEQRFSVAIEVHCNKTGPEPDEDNVSASAKSYLDGMAAELGVNDRMFAAPTVTFAKPRNSRFIITIAPIYPQNAAEHGTNGLPETPESAKQIGPEMQRKLHPALTTATSLKGTANG